MTLLEVDNMRVTYGKKSDRALIYAVDGVSFTLGAGETVGLVGESGSGKTTIGSAVLGLVQVSEGSVRFSGEDITRATRAHRRRLSSRMQMIFQDPFSSLNPSRTIGQTLIEPLIAQGARGKSALAAEAERMIYRVGLSADSLAKYPKEFSGGQRQRIAIARALISNPDFIVCDEAVSALDLSVQAEILNLLLELQEERGVSYLFITHDLSVVRHMAHRIVVLLNGSVVESGTAEDVLGDPAEDYTKKLLAAVPEPIPQRSMKRSE